MGITFAYELRLKSFIYEKSSTRKVTGLLRCRGKNGKKFKLTSGAPFARYATTNRKKIGLKKN